MTLTVVVGSSGSGKTTFLDHVHKLHSCTYIRQYHTLRPYVPVKKIPKFDPLQLPYWNLYSEKVLKEQAAEGKKNESYNPGVKIGGTMAGEFTAGLSGGQRKMMLFELVRQRTSTQSELLIVLDEPFAGVTDDFVPYIMERLDEMRLKHNILLVTNDHVAALTKMADSTITVSAIDRSKVKLNGVEQERELMLHAVAKGGEYMHSLGNQDLMFFMQTEVLTSPHVGGSMGFTVFAMILFLMSFWDSKAGQEALVLVGLQIVAFFAINPFLISLADWRNTVTEEADALMHASVQTMMHLKSVVTLILLIVINVITFGCLIACLDTAATNDAGMWVSMLFDSASLTLPFICWLYSKLPLQIVQILASLPFLFMIFFSTTFSPGSGVPGVKACATYSRASTCGAACPACSTRWRAAPTTTCSSAAPSPAAAWAWCSSSSSRSCASSSSSGPTSPRPRRSRRRSPPSPSSPRSSRSSTRTRATPSRRPRAHTPINPLTQRCSCTYFTAC